MWLGRVVSNDDLISKDRWSLAVIRISMVIKEKRYFLFMLHGFVSLWWKTLVPVSRNIIQHIEFLREDVLLTTLIISFHIPHDCKWKLPFVYLPYSFLDFWLLRLRFRLHLYDVDLRDFLKLRLLFLLRRWGPNECSHWRGVPIRTHSSQPVSVLFLCGF